MKPKLAATPAIATAALLLVAPSALAGSSSPPAAGADIGQVVIATVGAIVLTTVMLLLVAGHRTGRLPFIGRLAATSERATGTAGWASLPGELLAVSLLTAVFGMYWDISIHLDKGRDPGPLANPAHYFILLGLFGVLFSGVAAIALPLKRSSDSSLRLPNGWWAPLGAILIVVCGSISLIAFPLDDGWHRLFGQDVTLWGPTHLLLIGGASFSIVGQWILQIEGERARKVTRETRSRLGRLRNVTLAGSFLVGLSTFQAEFDFAVPQFRLVWHPILLMLAASIGLVAARVRLGRGGALGAVAVFIVIRGLLAVVVGPIIGNTTPHFPLYIVEALIVEGVALRISRDRPITLGASAGVLIGTVGLAAEWGWSHLWWTVPWPASLMPEALVTGLVAAVAGGVIGGFVGRSLNATETRERIPRWVVPAGAVAAVAVMAWALPMPNGSNIPRATITLHDVAKAPKRTVSALIRLDPPNAADNARWFTVTSWQGDGSFVDRPKRIGPGLYQTTKPVPVYGKWKTTLRLQRGSAVLGAPVYFPADQAIPAKEVPAPASFTRPFVRDKQLLQREQKKGVPGFLTVLAYLAVLAIWSTMIGSLGWGLVRLRRSTGAGAKPPPQGSSARAPRVTVPGRPASA
ncbi:MAG: hypothetical protein NVSMB25_18210 [Thermoleophilaceae bacterium]